MNRQSRLQNQHATFISAAEACDLLSIKPATLYTYVSRGLVYRIPTGQKRQSRYSLSDVLNLKARADARAGHGPVAAEALNWGQPVIQTSISTVGEEMGLTYRGHSVSELIRRKARFESVAELLWTGDLPKRGPIWPKPESPFPTALESLSKEANPFIVTAALLPLLAASDPTRHVMTAESEHQRARQVIRLAAAAVAYPESPARAQMALQKERVADVLAGALALPAQRAGHLDRILVLGAEHELNASTFAARVAASTGADLYACLSAAVGTHSGPRHGQAVDRVFVMLDEVKSRGDAGTAMRARLERGDSIPGFGHRLYLHGDPRATPLMKISRAVAPRNTNVQLLWDLIGAAKDAQYYPPNLDMGLAMMAEALGIARSKASSLFMIGRFAGWIAHILEQRTQRSLLRPRAEYISLPD